MSGTAWSSVTQSAGQTLWIARRRHRSGVERLGGRAPCRADRLAQRELSEIDRAADDHATDATMAQSRDRLDVVDGSDAPRVDDVPAERARHRFEAREIDALKRAVDRDVREDDDRDAGDGKALHEIDRADVGRFGPAFRHHHPVTRVDRDGEAIGVSIDEAPDE